MGIEIERKFLVNEEMLMQEELGSGSYVRQGYIMAEKEKTVRVRVYGERAFVTFKGMSKGAARPEYEYEILVKDAQEMLDLFAESEIVKTRYKFTYEDTVWEVDIFEGDNKGLILAEAELESEGQDIQKPVWIGAEVTGDERFNNSYLSKNPFGKWKT